MTHPEGARSSGTLLLRTLSPPPLLVVLHRPYIYPYEEQRRGRKSDSYSIFWGFVDSVAAFLDHTTTRTSLTLSSELCGEAVGAGKGRGGGVPEALSSV